MARKKRPTRTATETTVRELIPYSGYPLEEGREEIHVGGLGELLGIVTEWEGLELGYRFRDGEFGNVPMEAQYWARWRSSRQQARDEGKGEGR
jgi:hypothetical protein